MDAQIKPIETQYKGYRFRSRLEARWAVFFDALGFQWEYEPEGFELADGVRYLPDFLVDDWWVEVKATPGDTAQFDKARQFAEQGGGSIVCVGGLPDVVAYPMFWQTGASDTCLFCAEKYAPVFYSSEHPAWYALTRKDSHPDPENGLDVLRAVKAARSARFEFGESGAGAERRNP